MSQEAKTNCDIHPALEPRLIKRKGDQEIGSWRAAAASRNSAEELSQSVMANYSKSELQISLKRHGESGLFYNNNKNKIYF
jgi:argininosuccinate lyase